MLYELGIKFGIQGADSSLSWFDRMKRSVMGLSQTVDNSVPASARKLDLMANSAHRMARSVESSMRLAKIAVAGFLTGRAVQGLANWMGAGAEADKRKDFLRYFGASEADLAEARKQAMELSRKVPGFSSGDYFKSMFTVKSLHGAQGMGQVQAVNDSMTYLSKIMDSSIDAATDYYKVMYSSFGSGLSAAEKTKFHERVLAGTQTALEHSGALPTDLKSAMAQVGPVYSALGKKLEDALTDISVLAPALGGGEKAGTALRNLMSVGGESYGKLFAAVKQAQYESMMGKKLEFMGREQQSEWADVQKKFIAKQSEVGGSLLQKDPATYWANVGKMIDAVKAKGGDWMGTLVKHGFERESVTAALKMAEAYKSKDRQELYEKFAGGDPARVKQIIQERSKSFASQYELFEQKAKGLSDSFRKFFEPFAIDVMGPWGDQLARLTDAWNANTGQMKANAHEFFQSIGSGFSAAFGGLPDISAKARELIDTLASNDPAKWRELGDELGRIAGTNLRGLVESLGQLKEIGNALMPVLKAAAWLGGKAAEGYSLYKKEVLPDVSRKFDPLTREDQGLLSRLFGEKAEGPAFPGWAGPTAPERRGFQDRAAPPSYDELRSGLQAPISPMPWERPGSQPTAEAPSVNNEVRVFLDGSEIAARMEEHRSSEHDRNRRGAGELGFAR